MFGFSSLWDRQACTPNALLLLRFYKNAHPSIKRAADGGICWTAFSSKYSWKRYHFHRLLQTFNSNQTASGSSTEFYTSDCRTYVTDYDKAFNLSLAYYFVLCLSSGVTWGKVVSLYAVAGALAVDCVRHGHPAMVHTIVDCMGEFVRKSLTTWLKKRGGWVREKKFLPHYEIVCLLYWAWNYAADLFKAAN